MNTTLGIDTNYKIISEKNLRNLNNAAKWEINTKICIQSTETEFGFKDSCNCLKIDSYSFNWLVNRFSIPLHY